MKINRINKISRVYESQQARKVSLNKKRDERDKLSLSDNAVEYQIALEKIKELPDIRKEKVEKIEEQIKTGTYEINGKKIAEKMMEDVNFDKRV